MKRNKTNRKRTPPPAQPSTVIHPPAPTIQNRTTSFGSALSEGFAWGIGTSLARNLFSHSVQKENIQEKNTMPIPSSSVPNVDDLYEKYNQCMEKSNSNYENCQYILNPKD